MPALSYKLSNNFLHVHSYVWTIHSQSILHQFKEYLLNNKLF